MANNENVTMPRPSEMVRVLVARGDKIAAIKAYRAESGLGLRQAKAVIDREASGEFGPLALPIAPAKPTTREAVYLERERQKQQKVDAIAQGENEAARLNAELERRYEALRTTLTTGVTRQSKVDFQSLKDYSEYPDFRPPARLANPAPVPKLPDFMPPALTFFGKLFGKAEHAEAVLVGKQRFGDACVRHVQNERQRKTELQHLAAEHEQKARDHTECLLRQQSEIDDFECRYHAGDTDAISSYCELVLTSSPYPDGFPDEFRLAYVPDSKQVVVDYQLPTFDVVPKDREFRYVKARNEITALAARVGERRALYTEVVSAVAIRTIHELLASDAGEHIDVVVFNGYVRTIDPGTGSDVQPYLVTARATRDEVAGLDLLRVDPMACLRHLKAQVSRSPSELQPIRPIVDFNMVDPRFIEHGDVLAKLDERPNLMELTPGEFETLVTNLFEKMGLETRLTQASRDGGVDCVAYDQRPILGGKVVIQAKRYKHVVGVSAVRDLFGTMHNEGANKGILVTTSDYGKAAFDFANGKPVELINGSNLLYLLKQGGIDAKIEMPEDWQDPVVDF